MRTSTDKRIRGRKLQAIRARYFDLNPLCKHCLKQGRVRPATELDHIKALCNGGKDEPANRQGLCTSCHETKTLEDMGYHPRTRFGADGNPL